MLHLFFLRRMDAHVLAFVPQFFGNYKVAWHVFLLLWSVGLAVFANLVLAEEEHLSPPKELYLQQEREALLKKEQENRPDFQLSSPVASDVVLSYPESEKPCFVISKIKLEGEQASDFSFALTAVTNPKNLNQYALNRCLGSEGVNGLLSFVQNKIVEKGFVTTRILVKPQNLKTGELVLTVIPGRVNSLKLSDDSVSWTSLLFAFPVSVGDILNLRDLEQGLENLKRLPTADATIDIQPAKTSKNQSENFGQSDVLIRYQQRFPLRLNLTADDTGEAATGKYKGGASVSFDNPLRLNDLLVIGFNHNIDEYRSKVEGTRAKSFHYSVPYGPWLFSASVNQHRSRYLMPGALTSYRARSSSNNSEFSISRLVYRDKVRKTTLSGHGFYKKSRSFLRNEEIAVQRRRNAGWGLGANHREFIGKNTLTFDLLYRHGISAFDPLSVNSVDIPSSTRFQTMTGEVDFKVPFTVSILKNPQNFRYELTGRGQWNFTPIAIQEHFAIGNRYTVRGFDGRQNLSAERGYLVQNELSADIGKTNQEIFLGADFGKVFGHSTKWLAGNFLSGGVVGFRGGYKVFQYEVFAGKAFKKPKQFETKSSTLGFNVSASF